MYVKLISFLFTTNISFIYSHINKKRYYKKTFKYLYMYNMSLFRYITAVHFISGIHYMYMYMYSTCSVHCTMYSTIHTNTCICITYNPVLVHTNIDHTSVWVFIGMCVCVCVHVVCVCVCVCMCVLLSASWCHLKVGEVVGD